MIVFDFPPTRKTSSAWQFGEVQRLAGACAHFVASGEASGWETAQTEQGDPQFYLLAPPPDYDCILCVSRLGNLYVLEDGCGHILFEHANLTLLAEQVCTILRRRKNTIVAKLIVVWVAVREVFEEKVEPILHEPMELLTHTGPQFAALI